MPDSIDALHNAHSTRDKLVALLTQLHDRRTNTYTCKSRWQRRHLPPSPAHVRAHLITHNARAWRHCASWRAAQAPIHRVTHGECPTQQRSPRRHASSLKRRAAIAAAARRRPRPACGDMCSGHMPRKSLQHWDPCHNHQNNHAACQQCSCDVRACANGGDKSSIFAARMAGRASGGRARIPSCGA